MTSVAAVDVGEPGVVASGSATGLKASRQRLRLRLIGDGRRCPASPSSSRPSGGGLALGMVCGRQEPGNLVPVVLAGVRQKDVPGNVGTISGFGCHGVTQRGVRTSRRLELGAKAASWRELRRHARLAYVATCMNALRYKNRQLIALHQRRVQTR